MKELLFAIVDVNLKFHPGYIGKQFLLYRDRFIENEYPLSNACFLRHGMESNLFQSDNESQIM